MKRTHTTTFLSGNAVCVCVTGVADDAYSYRVISTAALITESSVMVCVMGIILSPHYTR